MLTTYPFFLPIAQTTDMILIHYIRLTRPVNFVITAATVILIGWLIGDSGFQSWFDVLAAAFSAALIGAGANAQNDAFDAAIDRINKPERPVAAGHIGVSGALRFGYILSGAGMTIGAAINPVCALIAISTPLLLYVYNRYLKKTALWGNLSVSAITGLALIYTGAAVQNLMPAVIPAVFAFLIHLAREIVKDMEDIEGDRIHGAMTFPVRNGLKKSSALVAAVILMLIAVTVWAAVNENYSIRFMIMLAAGVYPLLIYSVMILWIRPGKATYSQISSIFKICMVTGLIAILLG